MISTTLLCSVEFIRTGVEVDIESSVGQGPDLIVQRLVGGRQAQIPLSWIQNVSATSGVRLATPRVWGYTQAGAGRLLTVMGINATEYGSMYGAIGTDILLGGRFLGESDARKMIVGQGIVDMMAASGSSFSISVGSMLSLIAFNGSLIEFEVVGIFSSKSKIYSYDLILTDLVSARAVFGVENLSCTDIAVWIDFASSMNSIALQLDTAISEARILTRDAMRTMMMRTYGDRAGIVALLWATVLLVVVLLAFTASSAGSDESRSEVGLLKALGFDTVDVIEIRMFEALTVGLLGASLGISCAIVYDFIMNAPLIAGYMLGWNLVLLNGGLPLAISVPTVFTVFALAVVPIMVATVVPSWRNAITEPDVVLRGV